jgi:hypothetical protein
MEYLKLRSGNMKELACMYRGGDWYGGLGSALLRLDLDLDLGRWASWAGPTDCSWANTICTSLPSPSSSSVLRSSCGCVHVRQLGHALSVHPVARYQLD